MSTPLNVIPLENPGAHIQTLNLRFRRLVSQQTNLSTEVNIMACLDDGFLQTKPVRPPYLGTAADRQNQEADYDDLISVWTLNVAAHKTCRDALIAAMINFDEIINFHELNIFQILQVFQDNRMFAMNEGCRQFILSACKTIAPGVTFSEHGKYIRNQAHPELQNEVSKVRLYQESTEHVPAFRLATEAYNLHNPVDVWDMVIYENFMLHAITVNGEDASCNFTRAKAQPTAAAARGRNRQPTANARQPPNARNATTVAQKCQQVAAGTHPNDNTPTGPNALDFFCFFHGHGRSHGHSRTLASIPCRVLGTDPLASAAMKAATGPCVLANTIGTFYHSCPNIQA